MLALSIGGPVDAAQPARLHAADSSTAAINVDVSPLLAKGLGTYARMVQLDLLQALEAKLAARLASGARLSVVVSSIWLSDDIDGGGGSGDPNMTGTLTLVAPNGRLIGSHEILAIAPFSSFGDLRNLNGNTERQTAAVCGVFAGWAARYFG